MRVINQWYLPLLTLATGITLAKLYLTFYQPTYTASATLKVEEVQNEFSALSGKSYTSRLTTESQVLKSRTVCERAIAYLNCSVTGILSRSGKKTCLSYANWKAQSARRRDSGLIFFVTSRPGVPLARRYLTRFASVNALVDRIISGLTVTEQAKFSSVAIVSKSDLQPCFAADVVNAVIKAYTVYDVEQRNELASQVMVAINDQLNQQYLRVQRSGMAVTTFGNTASLNDLHLSPGLKNGVAVSRLDVLQIRYATEQRALDFLLQKKIGLQISRATVLPATKLIDPAVPNYEITSPAPYAVWRAACILGILSGLLPRYFTHKFRPF